MSPAAHTIVTSNCSAAVSKASFTCIRPPTLETRTGDGRGFSGLPGEVTNTCGLS